MPDPATPKPDLGPVYHATGWRAVVLWCLTWLLRAWSASLRFDIDWAAFAAARARSEPVTIMLWHNRLFVMPWMARSVWPGRTIHALVSASRDGAVLTRLLGRFGVKTVRGSSSRFGREALQALIAVQRGGGDIAITPDGPRGPIFQLKAGAMLAARRTRSPILLLGVSYARASHLRSWDRFCVPWPFSRVAVRIEVLDTAAIPGGLDGVEFVRCRLLELSGESPAAWPRPVEDEEPATASEGLAEL